MTLPDVTQEDVWMFDLNHFFPIGLNSVTPPLLFVYFYGKGEITENSLE
jgi:hypothetical protein